MAFPIGAAIGAGANILGTLLTNKANKNSQQREMDFARESYAQQRSDVLDDRAHEEAYNSPIQQAQRLRMAGMSPQDYMSDPVSTSTGDSGSISQPESYRADNPLANFMQAGLQHDQMEFNRAQLQEQKRVNDSVIAKNEAETVKTAGDNYRAGQSLKMEGERLDMDKQRFMDEVRRLRLSNQEQEQINKHNDAMFPLIERAQKIDTELKEETKDLVKSKLKSEVVLNQQNAKNLAQSYTMNGPSAFISELTEQMYGDNTKLLTDRICDEMHCDAEEASLVLIETGIKNGTLKGEYGDGVQGIAVGTRIASAMKPDGNGSASRGLLGSIVKALSK